jgi:hypothetical protein
VELVTFSASNVKSFLFKVYGNDEERVNVISVTRTGFADVGEIAVADTILDFV